MVKKKIETITEKHGLTSFLERKLEKMSLPEFSETIKELDFSIFKESALDKIRAIAQKKYDFINAKIAQMDREIPRWNKITDCLFGMLLIFDIIYIMWNPSYIIAGAIGWIAGCWISNLLWRCFR